VFGGTAKVGTGSVVPDSSIVPGFPLGTKKGTINGLLVGVGVGTNVLVGEAVNGGGSSGFVSTGGLTVSSITPVGVLVAGMVLVGSFVAGISVAVSEGTIATADAIVVGDGSKAGELGFAKLFAANKTMTMNAEKSINKAITRDDELLINLLKVIGYILNDNARMLIWSEGARFTLARYVCKTKLQSGSQETYSFSPNKFCVRLKTTSPIMKIRTEVANVLRR